MSQPRVRKLLQPGAPPAVVNASAQLTAAQLEAVRRFSTWSPGSMPWIDANAVYVRLYKSGNDMFKGERLSAYACFLLFLTRLLAQQTSWLSTMTARRSRLTPRRW